MPRKPKPTALELIELAKNHLAGRDPFAAVKALREAADTIEAAGVKFVDALDKAIGAGKPKAPKP